MTPAVRNAWLERMCQRVRDEVAGLGMSAEQSMVLRATFVSLGKAASIRDPLIDPRPGDRIHVQKWRNGAADLTIAKRMQMRPIGCKTGPKAAYVGIVIDTYGGKRKSRTNIALARLQERLVSGGAYVINGANS